MIIKKSKKCMIKKWSRWKVENNPLMIIEYTQITSSFGITYLISCWYAIKQINLNKPFQMNKILVLNIPLVVDIAFKKWTIPKIRRCPWCNGYRRRKWTRRYEFKSWTRLIAFHIALIPLGKVWIQLFSLQLWVNSRTDWFLQPWWGNLSRRRKTLNSNMLNSA